MGVQFSGMVKTAEDLDYVWTLMKAYDEWFLDDDFHDEQTVKALISKPWFSYFYAHNERGEKIGFVCFQHSTAGRRRFTRCLWTAGCADSGRGCLVFRERCRGR